MGLQVSSEERVVVMSDILIHGMEMPMGGYRTVEIAFDADGYPMALADGGDVYDVIPIPDYDELMSEVEKYRHAAFVIGEICVDASKQHITPEAALQKIRKSIYYNTIPTTPLGKCPDCGSTMIFRQIFDEFGVPAKGLMVVCPTCGREG